MTVRESQRRVNRLWVIITSCKRCVDDEVSPGSTKNLQPLKSSCLPGDANHMHGVMINCREKQEPRRKQAASDADDVLFMRQRAEMKTTSVCVGKQLVVSGVKAALHMWCFIWTLKGCVPPSEQIPGSASGPPLIIKDQEIKVHRFRRCTFVCHRLCFNCH